MLLSCHYIQFCSSQEDYRILFWFAPLDIEDYFQNTGRDTSTNKKNFNFVYLNVWHYIYTQKHTYTHIHQGDREARTHTHKYNHTPLTTHKHRERETERERERERRTFHHHSRSKTSWKPFSSRCPFFNSAARSQFGVDKTDVRVMAIVGLRLASWTKQFVSLTSVDLC